MTIWFFWEICVNTIGIVAGAYLFSKQLGVAKQKKRFMLFGIVLFITLLSTSNFIDLQMAFVVAPGFTIYANRLINLGITLVFVFLIFNGSVSKKILWCLVPMFLSAIADAVSLILISAITEKSIGTLMQYGPDRFCTTIVHIFVMVVSCISLSKLGKAKKKMFIPKSIQIFLILILILSTITVDILIDNAFLVLQDGSVVMNIGEIVTCITFLLIVFFVFILVTRVGILSSENMNFALEKQKNELENNFFDNFEPTIEELRETKHDIHNHLKTIQMFLVKKDYAELEVFFDNMYGEIDPLSDIVLTKNKTLNSILYHKMILMKSNNIDFHYVLLDAEQMEISKYDVNSIFGNLLDNAIEACQKLDNSTGVRYIRLSTKKNENMFLIKITNSYNGVYKRISKNNFVTSKSTVGHGLGIKHIERILKNYGGHLQIQTTVTEFSVICFLPTINLSNKE